MKLSSAPKKAGGRFSPPDPPILLRAWPRHESFFRHVRLRDLFLRETERLPNAGWQAWASPQLHSCLPSIAQPTFLIRLIRRSVGWLRAPQTKCLGFVKRPLNTRRGRAAFQWGGNCCHHLSLPTEKSSIKMFGNSRHPRSRPN